MEDMDLEGTSPIDMDVATTPNPKGIPLPESPLEGIPLPDSPLDLPIESPRILPRILPPPIEMIETEQKKEISLPPSVETIFCDAQCQTDGSCQNCIDPNEVPAIKETIDKACGAKSEYCNVVSDVKCAPDEVLAQAYRRADIAWPAEANVQPQEWKQLEPLLKLQYEWDKQVQGNTLRVLTQNLHFRPYDIGASVRTILETIGAETNWGKQIRNLILSATTMGITGGLTGFVGSFFNPYGLVAGTAVGVTAGAAKQLKTFLGVLAKTQVPLLLKDIILREMRFSLEDRAWINRTFPGLDTSGQLFNECVEIHSQNAQERRACEFVGAITMMEDHERPHIICIQEATHAAANRILYDKLELVGYKGVKQSDITLSLPILNPPGLAIYVAKMSGIRITAVDSLVFGSIGEVVKGNSEKDVSESVVAQTVINYFTQEKKTIGADNLGYKGCLAVELLIPAGVAGMDKDTYIIVATIHPSPYVKISTGDTLFDASSWFCMVEEYGEVVKIHQKQLDDAANFLRRFRKERIVKHVTEKRLQPGQSIQLFMTGDMNINRYAVSPDSAEEKNPFDASACCSVEFYDMLRRLNAEQPPVIPDPNQQRWETYDTKWVKSEESGGDGEWKKVRSEKVKMPAGRGGMFTWDGEVNKITQSPKWPESFSWIDYVLYSKDGPKPLYMDNRAIRLTARKAFPEVSTYFQPTCIMFRNELAKRYKRTIPEVEEQIRLHVEEREKGTKPHPDPLIALFGEEEMPLTTREDEALRKEIDFLTRRKRTLNAKVCQLETVNNTQRCDTSKKCSTVDLPQYDNTYEMNGNSFTCDYAPRVTVSRKSWKKDIDLRGIDVKNKAYKQTFEQAMHALGQMTAALRSIGVLERGYDFNPKRNSDGTYTIDREEYANPAFHAAEREVLQKNPYPMFQDVSDHYAVLSVIMLPSDTNQRKYNETMGDYQQQGIDALPAQISDVLELVKSRRLIGSMAPDSDFVYPGKTEGSRSLPPPILEEAIEQIAEKNAVTYEQMDDLRRRYTKTRGIFGYGAQGVLDAETVDFILNKAREQRKTYEETEALLQAAEAEGRGRQ